MDRSRRIASVFGPAAIALRVAGVPDAGTPRSSVLRKKYRKDKGRSEWALMDSGGTKPLRWFGEKRPSDDRVKEEGKRVQYFKHQGARKLSFVRHMAYGTLPSEEEFRMAFDLEVPGGAYQIRGPRGEWTLPVPDGDYSADELWSLISGAVKAGDDEKLGFVSSLLGTLGFEWR